MSPQKTEGGGGDGCSEPFEAISEVAWAGSQEKLPLFEFELTPHPQGSRTGPLAVMGLGKGLLWVSSMWLCFR